MVERNAFKQRNNLDYIKTIQTESKKADNFTAYCCEEDGLYGIILSIRGYKFILNPIELVCSLYHESNYDFLVEYIDDKNERKATKVTVIHDYYSIRWIIHLNKDYVYLTQFSFEIYSYVERVCTSVTQLYIALLEGNGVMYYDFMCNKEDLRICVEQIKMKHLLPSYFILWKRDVIFEDFIFKIHPKKANIYTAGIGKRLFSSANSQCDNDKEIIRHQLETFVMEGKAMIHFSKDEDYDGHQMSLEKVEVLRTIDYRENPIHPSYYYESLTMAKLSRCNRVLTPIITGFCNEKQLVRTLYQGLLRMTFNLPLEGDDDSLPPRFASYNKYKSLIIENYLANEKTDSSHADVRQHIVDHIITIKPELDLLFYDEGIGWYDDTTDLIDKEGYSIHFDIINDWQREIDDIVIDQKIDEKRLPDWVDFHRRGLILAHQLRSLLSDDYDLWYEAPSDDKSGVVPEPILIVDSDDDNMDWGLLKIPKKLGTQSEFASCN